MAFMMELAEISQFLPPSLWIIECNASKCSAFLIQLPIFGSMGCKFRLLVLIVSLISSHITYGQSKSNDTDSAQISFTIARLCTISYPKKAEENNIEGTVVVQFDIDSTCSYVNIKIVKGLGYGCDEEAVKAIKNCKKIYTKSKSNCTPRYNLVQTFVFSKPKED